MSVVSSTRFLALPLGELSPKGTERAKTKRSKLDNQIKDFKAVLLAPYGATAKHGTYYDRKFTFFKWDTIIYLPE